MRAQVSKTGADFHMSRQLRKEQVLDGFRISKVFGSYGVRYGVRYWTVLYFEEEFPLNGALLLTFQFFSPPSPFHSSFLSERRGASAQHALAVRYRLVSRGGGVGSADIGVQLTRA